MAFSPPQIEWDVRYFDEEGRPTREYQVLFDQLVQSIASELGAQAAAIAAQAAAQDAQDAADTAIAAAASATSDAATAQSAAEGANSVASLTNSGVTPNPLTATDAGADATITVAAHTRIYGDGSTLAIAGPVSLTGRAYSTLYYVYYDDPTRSDTTPTYQTGDRHLVGSITTPAAAAPPEVGDYVGPPGVGGIIP